MTLAQNFCGIVPSATTCYDLLQFIEREYQVSVNFWLSIEMNRGGGIEIQLLASGSGDLFDRLPPGHGMVRSRVLVADAGSIYKPMFACLLELGTQFDRSFGERPFPPTH